MVQVLILVLEGILLVQVLVLVLKGILLVQVLVLVLDRILLVQSSKLFSSVSQRMCHPHIFIGGYLHLIGGQSSVLFISLLLK